MDLLVASRPGALHSLDVAEDENRYLPDLENTPPKVT